MRKSDISNVSEGAFAASLFGMTLGLFAGLSVLFATSACICAVSFFAAILTAGK